MRKYTDEVNMHMHWNSAVFPEFIESFAIEFRFIPWINIVEKTQNVTLPR